jgi:hypothetical protein
MPWKHWLFKKNTDSSLVAMCYDCGYYGGEHRHSKCPSDYKKSSCWYMPRRGIASRRAKPVKRKESR